MSENINPRELDKHELAQQIAQVRASNEKPHRILSSLEAECDRLEDQLEAAKVEIARLNGCLEPGKASAISNGINALARVWGQPVTDSKPALIYISELIDQKDSLLAQKDAEIARKDAALQNLLKLWESDPDDSQERKIVTEALALPDQAQRTEQKETQ